MVISFGKKFLPIFIFDSICDGSADLREFVMAAYIYRPQTKFAKVMFFTRVCHSVQGEGGAVPGQVPPGPGTPPLGPGDPPGQVHASQQDQVHPPEQCMLGDTGNKRAVRILLECILVFNLNSQVDL